MIISAVVFVLWPQFCHSEPNGPGGKNTTTKDELFGNCYLSLLFFSSFLLSTVVFILWPHFGDSEPNGPVGEGEEEGPKRQSAVVQSPLPAISKGNCRK